MFLFLSAIVISQKIWTLNKLIVTFSQQTNENLF